MEELFNKHMKLREQAYDLEKEFYKKAHKISIQRDEVINQIIEIKLNEIGISFGDKVIDKKLNEAFFIGLDFRQKPHTYIKNSDEITIDDFEFKGKYKAVKQDGTISKKEPIGSLDFYSLKKC